MQMSERQRVLNKIQKISKKHQKIKTKNGGDFNIFFILRKTNDEVNLHSKFIYELLNTEGSHHQKNLFLDLFIKEALDIDDCDKSSLKAFREATTEYNRRLDFLIVSKNYLIGIEMKIDAGDQYGQLADYYAELKKKSKGRKIALFYLTRFGDNPSEKSRGNLEEGKEYHNRSFMLDIDWWLDKCIYSTKNIPKLNEIIDQYKTVVEQITGKITDIMEEDMNDIVKNVKDVEAMNTLVNDYPRLWAQKENEFWDELISKLEMRKVFRDRDYRIEPYECLTNEHGIDLIQKLRHKNGIGEIGFWIEKDFEKFRLTFEVYQKNNDFLSMWLRFCGLRNGTKNDAAVIELLEENLEIVNGRDIVLNEEIKFYAKDVTEPCFQLFDDNHFKVYIKDVADKIVKILTYIDKNEDDLSALIK